MYIKITVVTGAKEEMLTKTGEDSFDVSVREKPEQNMANKRVLELIRQAFGEEAGQIRIVSGHHSPNKIISVDLKKSL